MNDAIRKVLSTMFIDTRFVQDKNYVWKAPIDSTKLGVVVGSKGPRFTNYALGKTGYDRVITAKQKGIIDVACVVFANGDNAVDFTFVSAYDAVELQPRLEGMPLRSSDYGAFWILTPAWVRGDFDGGDAW